MSIKSVAELPFPGTRFQRGSNGYDGLVSGGFNDGPTSQKLATRVQAAVEKFHK